MIRRAPSWVWLALVGVAVLVLIVGAATTFSGDGGNDGAKAAPAETKPAPFESLSDGRKIVRIDLPVDGGISQAVDLNNPDFLDPSGCWEMSRPSGTTVFQDGKKMVLGEYLPDTRGAYQFANPGGGRVTVTTTPPPPPGETCETLQF